MTTGPTDEADDARRGRAAGGALPAAEGAAGVSGEVVEDLARGLHLEFDYLGSMKAYERAYSAYRREGNLLAAARAARTLGWFHGSVYGEWAVYRGWIGRAVSLLEQAGASSNEHGWVLLAQAQAGSGLDDQKRLTCGRSRPRAGVAMRTSSAMRSPPWGSCSPSAATSAREWPVSTRRWR
ncbi:MAG: hypothetical protein DLM61_21110 [Pseudonocardiales bacterium]|nr:MAG: hypothetical protein DLM61_21110 [Pseudonocardiales bacterium]